MRLRQLARKLGIQTDKIVGLLAENGHDLENEANSKLTEAQESLVIAHFAPEVESEPEVITEEETPVVTEEETLEEISTPEAVAEVEADNTSPEIAASEIAEEEDSDREMTEHEVPFGPPSHATSQVSDVDEENTPTPPVELPKKIALEPEVNSYPAYEEDESYAEAELIKTEVPELEGLKVLGKIELPEPKKPEPKEEGEEEKDEKGEKDEERSNKRGRRNPRGRDRKGRNGKPKLNSVEYERRKAEREAKRKKAEAIKREKEKKREHYLKNVKHKQPTANPDKKEQEEEMAPLPIIGQSRPKPKATPKPKGPKQKKGLKKLWAWLNGEYDKF